MKVTIPSATILAMATFTLAGPQMAPQTAGKSPAFERLLSLEGTWVGKASRGEGNTKADAGEVTVVYKVTAAHSVLQETQFPGTPHEMVTMYHADGPRIVLTHYCAAGNQPHMTLQPSTDQNVLSFTFSGGTNMQERDMHMHAVRITFIDSDHVISAWTSMKDGTPVGEARFDLTRKK
jgi:hypothetical protein